jgi:hypothetical protein
MPQQGKERHAPRVLTHAREVAGRQAGAPGIIVVLAVVRVYDPGGLVLGGALGQPPLAQRLGLRPRLLRLRQLLHSTPSVLSMPALWKLPSRVMPHVAATPFPALNPLHPGYPLAATCLQTAGTCPSAPLLSIADHFKTRHRARFWHGAPPTATGRAPPPPHTHTHTHPPGAATGPKAH